MACDVVLRLDMAQEHRALTRDELNLQQKLKRRILGLEVVERVRRKQASHITNIKLGDANTKYFHRRVNGRKKKNYIQRLKQGSIWVFNYEEKVNIIQDHFATIMGPTGQRSQDVNWDSINLPSLDLSSLAEPFTEEEIKHAILDIPSDKAPGPDGFTGAFYKACWAIIKCDVINTAKHYRWLSLRSAPRAPR